MDELAHAAGIDPVEMRRRNLPDPSDPLDLDNRDNSRLRAVLDAAAERFGWKERLALSNRGARTGIGIGSGVAIGIDKGGYVACCAEVEVGSDGYVRILRVVQAFECGAIVNPVHLESQVEGAIVQGIGGALFEAVRFEDGHILNPRLSDYRVPRFSDVPEIEILLLDRPDLPSAGAGECLIVGIAPAVGNAIFDATGMRLRGMPLVPNGLPSTPTDA